MLLQVKASTKKDAGVKIGSLTTTSPVLALTSSFDFYIHELLRIYSHHDEFEKYFELNEVTAAYSKLIKDNHPEDVDDITLFLKKTIMYMVEHGIIRVYIYIKS